MSNQRIGDSREELVKLETWARIVYGDDAPSIYTLRRWCQQGKIQPPAQKHGRAIYVKREARYINYNDPNFDGALQ